MLGKGTVVNVQVHCLEVEYSVFGILDEHNVQPVLIRTISPKVKLDGLLIIRAKDLGYRARGIGTDHAIHLKELSS